MRKEEAVLFPYIQTLESAVPGKHRSRPGALRYVQNPIRMMMADYEEDRQASKANARDSGRYTLPEGACPSYTALYEGLQDLERDLHRHIHLENNVLFPAAVDLEQSISTVV